MLHIRAGLWNNGNFTPISACPQLKTEDLVKYNTGTPSLHIHRTWPHATFSVSKTKQNVEKQSFFKRSEINMASLKEFRFKPNQVPQVLG